MANFEELVHHASQESVPEQGNRLRMLVFFWGGGGLNVVISSARWLMSCDGLSILLSFFKPSTPVRGLGAGVSPSGFRGSAGGHPA